MILFLLAAGEGTRFRPHTEVLPKPALPFCGAPLLYYSYFLARCLEPEKIVINTFHLSEKMREVGATLERFGEKVVFSEEQPLLLGSAGGMAKAKDHFKGHGGFVAMNADEVIIPQDPQVLRAFFQHGQQSPQLAHLMVMEHPEAGKKFGAVWVSSQGKVVGFGKNCPDHQEELKPYHFIGPMYFKERIFDHLDETPSNILHDCLKQAIQGGEDVGIFPIRCDWFETGNLTDYLHATEEVLKLIDAKNPFLLTMQRDLSLEMIFEKNGDVQILRHRTATVESSLSLKDWVVLGADISLNADHRLQKTVIADGVESIPNVPMQSALILK